MASTLVLPSALTYSRLPAGTPADVLAKFNGYLAQASLVDPSLPSSVAVGDRNPLILDLNDFDMGGASFRRSRDVADMATCGPIENVDDIDTVWLTPIGLLGDILNYPVLFEFDTEAELDNEVPEGLPHRTFSQLIDENDPESGSEDVVHTWRTWLRTDTVSEQGGKWYKKAANNNWLNLSDWWQVHLDTGLKFVTLQAYIDNAPTTEV